MSTPTSNGTHSAGGIIVNSAGLIALVESDGVFWTFPKGRLETGENPLQTALREIHEETGLIDLTFIKELGTYTRSKLKLDLSEEPNSFKSITLFLFKTSEASLQPQDPDITNAKWLTQETVVNQLTHPQDRDFYLQIKSNFNDL